MNYYITVLNRFNVWYGFYQLMSSQKQTRDMQVCLGVLTMGTCLGFTLAPAQCMLESSCSLKQDQCV